MGVTHGRSKSDDTPGKKETGLQPVFTITVGDPQKVEAYGIWPPLSEARDPATGRNEVSQQQGTSVNSET